MNKPGNADVLVGRDKDKAGGDAGAPREKVYSLLLGGRGVEKVHLRILISIIFAVILSAVTVADGGVYPTGEPTAGENQIFYDLDSEWRLLKCDYASGDVQIIDHIPIDKNMLPIRNAWLLSSPDNFSVIMVDVLGRPYLYESSTKRLQVYPKSIEFGQEYTVLPLESGGVLCTDFSPDVSETMSYFYTLGDGNSRKVSGILVDEYTSALQLHDNAKVALCATKNNIVRVLEQKNLVVEQFTITGDISGLSKSAHHYFSAFTDQYAIFRQMEMSSRQITVMLIDIEEKILLAKSIPTEDFFGIWKSIDHQDSGLEIYCILEEVSDGGRKVTGSIKQWKRHNEELLELSDIGFNPSSETVLWSSNGKLETFNLRSFDYKSQSDLWKELVKAMHGYNLTNRKLLVDKLNALNSK